MRYWRDPDTMEVSRSNDDAPADPGDVVVLPLADWQRLVELVTRQFPACPCDGNCCEACREDSEIDAIIKKVQP